MLVLRHVILSAAVCSLALGGCANVSRSVQRMGTNIHESAVEADRRMTKMMESEYSHMEAQRKPDPHTAYCYRTLGDITCYKTAQPSMGARFVGKQVPTPVFNEYNSPLPQQKPEAVYITVADSEDVRANYPVTEPQSVVMTPVEPLTAEAPIPVYEPLETQPQEPRPLMPQIE